MTKPREDSIDIHEQKRIRMPLALLATIVALTAAATFAYAAIGKRIDAAAEKATAAQTATENLEKRARVIENAQERMANDIGWIRRAMEEDQRRRSQ
jgi:hypothetical protein